MLSTSLIIGPCTTAKDIGIKTLTLNNVRLISSIDCEFEFFHMTLKLSRNKSKIKNNAFEEKS